MLSVTASNIAYVEFGGIGAVGSSVHADNFSFTASRDCAVPEPASWATMIAGVGAAGGMLRRRARTGLRLA